MQEKIPSPPISARTLVAYNIRRLRESQKISQERLADLSGLHRTYISSVERGERNVTIDTMERLAKALGVEISIFFHEEILHEKTTP